MKEAKNTEPISSNGVQHELGTELSVILACCFLLRESLQDTWSEEELRKLHKIERSAEKIHALSARLLGPTSATRTDRSSPQVVRCGNIHASLRKRGLRS